MHVNGSNNRNHKGIPNRNVSYTQETVGYQYSTLAPPNNQRYLNSNQIGTISTDTSFQIFPGTPHTSTVSTNIKNTLSFPMRPNNSFTSIGNNNSVNLLYGNSVHPMLPVPGGIPPTMVQNIPLHLIPPVSKMDNSLSVPPANNLLNHNLSTNNICHSEMQFNDSNNSQRESLTSPSIYHYGQSARLQNISVPSSNQGCINPSQTQTVSIPGTSNINNIFCFPMSASNSFVSSANANNSGRLPYGNNLQSMSPVATRMPPPMMQNINLNMSPHLLNIDPVLPLNFILPNPVSTCDKEIKIIGFLSKFTTKRESSANSIKIPVYRTTLKAAFSKLKQLIHHKSLLKDLLHVDESTWKSEMKKVSVLQSELSEICQLASAPYLLNNVLKKLKLIKKKREQKKKTKINILSAERKKELKRKELHAEIDKWLDDIKEKNLKTKREAEMKKEADFILLEVRRKIYEAKRTLEKIKVLEKLRQARQANAVKKGLYILPEHDKSFEKKVSIWRETMVKQLADYEAEETALKVMLETEQEGQLSFLHQLMKTLQEKKQTHITNCLFGNTDDPLPTDPLYLFHQYHTAASSSIENLIQIRRQWDMYLADDGEAIPQQWVIPTSTNSSWKKWLVNAKD